MKEELGRGEELEEIKTGSGVTERGLGVDTARPGTYLGFQEAAQQPGLRGPGPAAALSGSRKALGTWAEGLGVGVGNEVLQS